MWIGLFLVAAGGVIVVASSMAYERGVTADMRALEESTRTAQSPPLMPTETPPVVERYLMLSGADGVPIRSARMQHGGAIRTAPGGSWSPVHGTQLFVADSPGFVWWGRMKLAPGVWVDARDELVSGTASMNVTAESVFPLADVATPELDQGAALRVLGEMVLFPTSFRDARYVRWEAIDATKARGFLRLGDREVSAVFEFGTDGFPQRIRAQRYRDVGGKGVLTPWFATMSDYRDVDGVRIPFQLEATWELEDGPFPCIRFSVEKIQFERGGAARTKLGPGA